MLTVFTSRLLANPARGLPYQHKWTRLFPQRTPSTDSVVGHILFSDLLIETEHAVTHAVSLAPMAVITQYQRQGIGSELVRRGLELCRERGKSIVVVLGHPAYYPRFGFSAELAKNLRGPYSGNAWMALELVPGALDGVEGTVRYPKAFDVLS
ncbi:MAG: N-acetyltransferase [Bryobacteraceae bacterium]|jgi:putative acetyltransferase